MKINYNVQGKERKALVNIIAETINDEAEYQKAPTYSYIIGNFTVTRDGAVECDDETANNAFPAQCLLLMLNQRVRAIIFRIADLVGKVLLPLYCYR